MINPLNIAVTVPFEGKTYNCDLTLGSIPAIEGELNVGILCPTVDSLWSKPEFFQRTVLLYCLLKSTKIQNLSFARCSAEIVGPNASRIAEALKEAAEKLQPHILRLNNLTAPEDAERPTDAQSSGQDSGPSES